MGSESDFAAICRNARCQIANGHHHLDCSPVAELERWWNSHDLPGVKAVKLGMGGALESITEALKRPAENLNRWDFLEV